MEKAWWEVQDPGDAAGSGSDMNDESLRPLPDKDFVTDPRSGKSVFAILLLVGLPIVIFLGGGFAFSVFLITEEDWWSGGLFFGFLFSFFGWALFLVMRFLLAKHRLRVQHSIDLLVIESSIFGRVYYAEERRLSEAAYLEYKESVSENYDGDGNFTKTTNRVYKIRSRSSEDKKWKLTISNLILRFENHRQKAEEIANAIGIEFIEK